MTVVGIEVKKGADVPPLPPGVDVGMAVPPPPPPPGVVGCPVTPGTGVEGVLAGDGAVVVEELEPAEGDGAKVDPTEATGANVVVPFDGALGAVVVRFLFPPPPPLPVPIAVGIDVEPGTFVAPVTAGVGEAVPIGMLPRVVGANVLLLRLPAGEGTDVAPTDGIGTPELDNAPGEGADVMTCACA